MILDTIKTDTIFRVETKNLSQTKIPANGLGFLKYTNNNYAIFLDEKLYNIEILDKNKLNEINYFFLNRNYTAIINIIESLKGNIFTLEIIFFAYPIQEIFVPFFVSLDEKILKTAKNKKLISRKDNIDKLSVKIKEIVSFKINGTSYFLTSTAIASQQEVFAEELNSIGENIKKIENNKKLTKEEKEQYIEKNKLKAENLNIEKKDLAFTIHGENIHLPVKKEISQSGYKFTATKLVSFNNSLKKDSLRLIKGNIEFKNGLVSEKIAKDLGDIVESEGSYLNTWDKYIDKEGEILIEKAKKIGVINILGNPQRIDVGYDLRIENFSQLKDSFNVGDFLSMGNSEPGYIKDNLSWLEYIAQKEIPKSINVLEEKVDFFEVIKIDNEFITIKTDERIDFKSKKIVLSIYGDEIQLQRKLEARKRILEAKSANPYLGLLIEDTDKVKKYLKKHEFNRELLEPLSEVIKNKIFSQNPPTPNQIKAIDIALNTPDFAIIQGPPGTGKTTVLTAIMERLNEVSDKENIRGQVLVAGFQHDAVENIIQRLNINGIPTPKFGKKSTTTFDISAYYRIMEWSERIASNLREKLPELSNHRKISKLNKYFEVYLKTPSKTFSIELLNFIINELSTYLDKDVVADSKKILASIKIKTADNVKELREIYSLRTTEVSFMDDGVNRNSDLIVSDLGKLLNDDEKSILKHKDLNDLDNYLPKLQKLKYNLIDRLYPKPIFKAEKPNSDIIKLKDRVEEQLSKGTSTKDRINTILANYINEIESNPFALKSMIEEYSYVFSSTTGQSSQASRQKITGHNKDVIFDTLIIDEAARVAPMDLLLAMVLAKKRIILVGDHRQLPHMVEDEIIKSANLNENEFIKESMFGYLKKRAEKLEKFDNIKRVITLENQFRTHPLLGEFISKNFYEKYNEGFKSPLGTIIGKPDDFFYQKLDGIENNSTIWIDVPNTSGKEKKAWNRECEAKEIMKYLRKWMFSDEGVKLTFGIITFYRDQVKVINELLKKEFTNDQRDNFHNRLKIGTVDSFQGMEFDIVFLSVVRSLDVNRLKKIKETRNPFGFLISKNRLCVSMSRQIRSLIVVGDKDFFESERAKSDVEELYNFLQLCINNGKVL